MSASQHKAFVNPYMKLRIQNEIIKCVYGNLAFKLEHRLQEIILKSMIATGYSHESFFYKGKLYTFKPQGRPKQMNKLVPALHDVMDTWLRDNHQYQSVEQPIVNGFIAAALNLSDSLVDYLLVFPETFHSSITIIMKEFDPKPGILSQKDMEEFLVKHQHGYNLLKQRLVLNLLL